MLGCTNYKKDGTGCNFSMLGFNYTQDKSKILKDESGRVLRSDIKSDVNGMLSAISSIYEKYSTFRFGYKTLVNFLNGEEDKAIIQFKLNTEKGYGMFKAKPNYYVSKLIYILLDLNALEKYKNDKGFENLNINQNCVADNQIILLEKQLFNEI